MAFIFVDPIQTNNAFGTYGMKDVAAKAFRLNFPLWTTSATNTFLGQLPADVTILGFDTYVKTALSTATSPTLSLGTASGGTQFTSALAITNTTGTQAKASPVTNIMQAHDNIGRTDINLWAATGCSTGNATAGEIYLIVYYVR